MTMDFTGGGALPIGPLSDADKAQLKQTGAHSDGVAPETGVQPGTFENAGPQAPMPPLQPAPPIPQPMQQLPPMPLPMPVQPLQPPAPMPPPAPFYPTPVPQVQPGMPLPMPGIPGQAYEVPAGEGRRQMVSVNPVTGQQQFQPPQAIMRPVTPEVAEWINLVRELFMFCRQKGMHPNSYHGTKVNDMLRLYGQPHLN